MPSRSPIIYFDGGCKPNPGQMEICIVVCGLGTPQVFTIRELGHGTNNVAEWSALVWAIQKAEELGLYGIEIIGDSQLVVNQARGKWKIKHDEFKIFKFAFDGSQLHVQARLKSVSRKRNLAGRYLERGRL